MIGDELIVPTLPRWATVHYTEPYGAGAADRVAAVLVHAIDGATATVELREGVSWTTHGKVPPIYGHPQWFDQMQVGEVRQARLVDIRFAKMIREEVT